MPGVVNLNETTSRTTESEIKLLSRLKNGKRKDGSTMNMPSKGGNRDLSDDELKKYSLYAYRVQK